MKAGTHGVELRYSVGESELEPMWLTYRPFKVHALEAATQTVIARAELGLLGCTNRRATNDGLFQALDDSSQESADFGTLLTTTYQGRVASLFKYCRHVANFVVLELRGDRCGHGLGLQLGQQLLALLQRRFNVGLFFLKPFPLQFQGALPPRGAPEFDAAADLEYRLGRLRLARKYAKHWGAIKLPGSSEHMLILGDAFDDAVLVSTREWWTIKSPKEFP